MEKRKLGEQWVEGGRMYKAVAKGSCDQNTCSWKGLCVDEGLVVIDLGIVNEDGCLPSDFGVYPEVYEHVLIGINGYMVKAYIPDPHVGKYAWGKTRQQAIDAWNRRV